ncbi:MAG: extracellular solute-binding protein, partial [Clostridia bacterium]|nr:extracellular solute-binding protein [Clostridia bacterium]
MKNRFRSLAAALACLLLVSCASDDAKTPDAAAEEPFVFPEETGTLVLYSEKTNHKRMQQAINLFGELYPDVKIDLQVLDQDAFYNRLRTEIPAGTGPDVIWETSTYLPDVYKTMAAGVFTDLNPYFLNDETFSFGDYVEGVLDGVIAQNPYNMGYFGVRYVYKTLTNQEIQPTVDTGATLITIDN